MALSTGAPPRTHRQTLRRSLLVTMVFIVPALVMRFAGLHRLLQPVLGSLDRLPPPQRAAIQAAFGLREAVVPDLFRFQAPPLKRISDAIVIAVSAEGMAAKTPRGPQCRAIASVHASGIWKHQ